MKKSLQFLGDDSRGLDTDNLPLIGFEDLYAARRLYACVHEVGHVLVCKHFNIRVHRATVNQMTHSAIADPLTDAIVASAGVAATTLHRDEFGDLVNLFEKRDPAVESRLVAEGADNSAIESDGEKLDRHEQQGVDIVQALRSAFVILFPRTVKTQTMLLARTLADRKTLTGDEIDAILSSHSEALR